MSTKKFTDGVIFSTTIKQYLDWKKLSLTQFADIIGYSRQGLSQIINKKMVPSKRLLAFIVKKAPDFMNYATTVEKKVDEKRLAFGDAVELLRRIYDSRDATLVTAIAHNLVQFSKLARPTMAPESELADRIARLEDKCDEAVKLIKEHHHPKVKRAVNDGET